MRHEILIQGPNHLYFVAEGDDGSDEMVVRVGSLKGVFDGRGMPISPRQADQLAAFFRSVGENSRRTREARRARADHARETRQAARRMAPAPRLNRAARPAVPAATKRSLAERSGGLCEAWLPGCLGKATDAHHRINTQAGGRHGAAKLEHDRLSDLLHLCRSCHTRVTNPVGEERVEYELHGLILRQHENPAMTSVVLGRARGRVWLSDDGQYLPEPPAGVA